MAEKIRERVSPDQAIDLALEVVADTTLPIERRLQAMWSLVDRGYRQPAMTTDLNVNGGGPPVRDWSAMPIEERRELLAKLRSVPALGSTSNPLTTEPEPSTPRPLKASATDDDET